MVRGGKLRIKFEFQNRGQSTFEKEFLGIVVTTKLAITGIVSGNIIIGERRGGRVTGGIRIFGMLGKSNQSRLTIGKVVIGFEDFVGEGRFPDFGFRVAT